MSMSSSNKNFHKQLKTPLKVVEKEKKKISENKNTD